MSVDSWYVSPPLAVIVFTSVVYLLTSTAMPRKDNPA
jgi:hypothetical protein